MIAAHPPVLPGAASPRGEKPRSLPRTERAEGLPGRWKYEGVGWTRLPLVIGIAVSLAFHGVFLFGFNKKPVARAAVAAQEIEIIQMRMPDLEEEKPDEVHELAEAADEAPAVAVPQLADLPSAVSVSAFVQPLQYVPDVSANLAAARTTQIPVNIGRARALQNMGTIFEINQLDRVPTPIMQPSPVFPYALRQTVSEARVLVEFIVDSNGDVVAPFVVNTTHAGFNESAVAGVSKWKFRPGMKAGKRVNTRVRAPVNFFIQTEE